MICFIMKMYQLFMVLVSIYLCLHVLQITYDFLNLRFLLSYQHCLVLIGQLLFFKTFVYSIQLIFSFILNSWMYSQLSHPTHIPALLETSFLSRPNRSFLFPILTIICASQQICLVNLTNAPSIIGNLMSDSNLLFLILFS